MNKWQIICPVTALMMVAIFGLVRQGRRESIAYVLAQTQIIGEELARGTNSPRLVELGPTLQARLGHFLTPKSGVAETALDDQSAPAGDGRGCSRLILSNAFGRRLDIRLRQEGRERFRALSITELQPGADSRQPSTSP